MGYLDKDVFMLNYRQILPATTIHRKLRSKAEANQCTHFYTWAARTSFYFYGELRYISEFLVHIPNGGNRPKKPYFNKKKNKVDFYCPEGASLKAQGAKKGVSDYILAFPRNGFPGLWLEMKDKNKPSALSHEQKNWLALMKLVGYDTAVENGWRAAAKKVCAYLGIEFKE